MVLHPWGQAAGLGQGRLGPLMVTPFLQQQSLGQDGPLIFRKSAAEAQQHSFGLAALPLALQHVGQQQPDP